MAITAERESPRLGIYGPLARVFKSSPSMVREGLWGLIFVSPWILGMIIFTVGPILASFYWSFTEFDILSTPRWTGIDNYVRALNINKVLPFWPELTPDRQQAREFLALHVLEQRAPCGRDVAHLVS